MLRIHYKGRIKTNRCTCHKKHCCCLHVNLAGLTDHVNYKLVKYRKIPVKLTAINGYTLTGKTYQVGIDYVEIKKENDTIVTILKDKIDRIKWLKETCES